MSKPKKSITKNTPESAEAQNAHTDNQPTAKTASVAQMTTKASTARASSSQASKKDSTPDQSQNQAVKKAKRTKEEIAAAKAEAERKKEEKKVEKAKQLAAKEEAKKAIEQEKQKKEALLQIKKDWLKEMEEKMSHERGLKQTSSVTNCTVNTAMDTTATIVSNDIPAAIHSNPSTEENTAGALADSSVPANEAANAKAVQWKVPESTFIDPPNEEDYLSDTSIASTEIVDQYEPGETLAQSSEIRQNILRRQASFRVPDSPLTDDEEVTLPRQEPVQTVPERLILRIPGYNALRRMDTNIPIVNADNRTTSAPINNNNNDVCANDPVLVITAPSDDPEISEDETPVNRSRSDTDIEMELMSEQELDIDIHKRKGNTRPKSFPISSSQNSDAPVQKNKRRLSNDTLSKTSAEFSKKPRTVQSEDSSTVNNNATKTQQSIGNNWRLKVQQIGTNRFLSPATGAGSRRSVSPSVGISSREASVEIQVAANSDVKKALADSEVPRVTTATAVRVAAGTALKSKTKRDSLTSDDSHGGHGGKSSSATRRYTMNDITVDHRRFRTVFIQTYHEYYMTLPNPFKIQAEIGTIIPVLQEIWNTVFPYDTLQLAADSSVKYIADQRFIEYRGRMGETACKIIRKYFDQKQREDPSCDDIWRRDFVNRALGHKSNPPFIWKNFEADDFDEKKKGIFRHRFITETLAYHFHEVRHSDQTAPFIKVNSLPRGALAVAACAIERALEMWITGNQLENQLSFSADNYRDRAQFFTDLAEPTNLGAKRWNLILEDAAGLVSLYISSRSSAPAPPENPEAAALSISDIVAMDEDSDLED